MTQDCFYIFRSSELYLNPDNTLPTGLPEAFSGMVADSLSLELLGRPSQAILLRDEAPRAEVVQRSVSGPGSSPVSSGSWVRLRSITASEEPSISRYAAPASRALGLLNWHDATRFCPRCGAPLEDHPVELARLCPSCARILFPRISPAIIVLVRKEGKILLARHAQRNQDVYSCLAGFLEHGETLEECVAREVGEETGIAVKNITYVGSQSWPFPDQHMVAFYADWASGEIAVDKNEIAEAHWFDPEKLPNTPMPGTVAWRLIHGVLAPSSKN